MFQGNNIRLSEIFLEVSCSDWKEATPLPILLQVIRNIGLECEVLLAAE